MIIASMQEEDILQVYNLNVQLGYILLFETFKKQFCLLKSSPLDALFVAKNNEKILGWMHLKELHRLHDLNVLEVVTLIVDENNRGMGIGTLLIQYAEEHAKKLRLHTIMLHSNIHRTNAALFYEKKGFTHSKTSKFFIKHLS